MSLTTSRNIPTDSEAVSKTAEQWHEDGRAISCGFHESQLVSALFTSYIFRGFNRPPLMPGVSGYKNMSYAPCRHKSDNDFSIVENGERFWACSNCDNVETWGSSWSYYGSIECKRCWASAIYWVACSDECADKLKAANKPLHADPKSTSDLGE